MRTSSVWKSSVSAATTRRTCFRQRCRAHQRDASANARARPVVRFPCADLDQFVQAPIQLADSCRAALRADSSPAMRPGRVRAADQRLREIGKFAEELRMRAQITRDFHRVRPSLTLISAHTRFLPRKRMRPDRSSTASRPARSTICNVPPGNVDGSPFIEFARAGAESATAAHAPLPQASVSPRRVPIRADGSRGDRAIVRETDVATLGKCVACSICAHRSLDLRAGHVGDLDHRVRIAHRYGTYLDFVRPSSSIRYSSAHLRDERNRGRCEARHAHVGANAAVVRATRPRSGPMDFATAHSRVRRAHCRAQPARDATYAIAALQRLDPSVFQMPYANAQLASAPARS